eukprot:5192168-Prymnesium_polylepis.1
MCVGAGSRKERQPALAPRERAKLNLASATRRAVSLPSVAILEHLEFAFRRLTHACSILMANDAVPVVFDMETQDPDDFLCLLFLASHPRVRLKAVTLVPGSPEQVGLVRWALGALGLDDDRVAVGAGDLVSKPAS